MSRPATGELTHDIGVVEAATEAAIVAIRLAISLRIDKLCIKTECEFLLAVGFWMSNWKRAAWRNNEGDVMQNCKDFQKLDHLLKEFAVTVEWAGKAVQNIRELQILDELVNDDAITVTWVSLFGNVSNVYLKHMPLFFYI